MGIRCRHLVAGVVAPLTAIFIIALPAGPASAIVPPPADVGVNLSAPSFPDVGTNFDFTVKVTNHGPNTATGVSVTDSLPTGVVTFQAMSSSDLTDTCTGTSYISCSLGSLATAEMTTITITVRRDKSDQAYDSVYLTSDADPYSDNNSDSVVVQQPLGSALPADVGIAVQAPSAPAIGSNYDYTITLTDFGPNPATNVKVTDYLPGQYVTFGSVTPINCSYLTSGSNPRVGCYFGSLGNGSSVVITISVTRVSGYPFSNSAYVASDADPEGATTAPARPSQPIPRCQPTWGSPLRRPALPSWGRTST